jgi:hypothetical protein
VIHHDEQWRFAMATPVALRRDFTGPQLRMAPKQTKDVPGIAAMVDDVRLGGEDSVRQPVAPHELPDILDRVEFGRFRRQRHERNVWWHWEHLRDVPSRLIENENGVRAGRNCGGDLFEMQGHRLGVI